MPAKRKWTDDDLRTAVASSTTYREVLRALGLADGPLAFLQKHIRALALDTTHFDRSITSTATATTTGSRISGSSARTAIACSRRTAD